MYLYLKICYFKHCCSTVGMKIQTLDLAHQISYWGPETAGEKILQSR